jgi:3-hydroxyisobutyrate dehydrogenase-like beta-hydroxyacid dehydrogenase
VSTSPGTSNGIGVIGLGNIGGAIAANLVADGHDVIVHDTDPTRATAIAGATAATTVGAVAEAAEITLLSLPTPAIVDDVARTWADAASADSSLVDLSTNSVASVRELGDRLEVSGHHLVEAPLTGGAIGAERRMLVFMVGGDVDTVNRVRPVLEPLGRALFHVGGLGLGNTMKLLNSLIAFTTTWVSLEGLSVAAKAGIPVPAAVEILRSAGASNFYLDRMVETIDQRGRPTQFALALAEKDANLIVETSAALDVPTPIAHAVLHVFEDAVAAGLGEADWSELVALAEQRAGVELRWNPAAT